MTGDISGKALAGTINGVAIGGEAAWSYKEVADKLDGTTGRDGGKTSTKPGCTGVEGTIKILIEVTAGINYRAGTITNLRLFYKLGDATPSLYCPVATFTDGERGAEVRGRFEATFNFANDGNYTIFK